MLGAAVRLLLMIVGGFAIMVCNERAADAQNYPWCAEGGKFDLDGPEPETVDQFDALLSAAIARNGCKHVWTTDLTDLPRSEGEMDPQHSFFGKVNYYWFERITV